MTPDQALLAIIASLAVVGVLLVGVISVRARRRRRSSTPTLDRARMGERAGPGTPEDAEAARVAAAIEALVGGIDVDRDGRRPPPPPWAAVARTPEAIDGSAPDATAVRPGPTDRPPSVSRAVADAATWSRAIREESARVARFGRAPTVVMAEVPRLQALSDRLGRGVAERVVTEATSLLLSDTRAVDRVARLGEARLGILLLETDEIAACGYVDRVRAVTDGWLQSAGLSIRLSFGWASPTDGKDVLAAAAAAEQRMHDADHHPTAAHQGSSPAGTDGPSQPWLAWPTGR